LIGIYDSFAHYVGMPLPFRHRLEGPVTETATSCVA
jgi:hypothetical protein